MISHEHQCIFVHIPKTAGTSIEHAIWGKEHFHQENFYGFPNPYQTGDLQHLKAFQMQQIVSKKTFNKYFTFSFVRNPWARAVSQYFYTMKIRDDLRELLNLPSQATFTEYVHTLEKVHFNPHSFINSRYKILRKLPFTIYPVLHIQWERQYTFVKDSLGEDMVDFIGRFENLRQDFQHVCKKIGLQASLPHRDQGVKRQKIHYSSYYTSTTQKIISNIYAKDIELFEYEFETQHKLHNAVYNRKNT